MSLSLLAGRTVEDSILETVNYKENYLHRWSSDQDNLTVFWEEFPVIDLIGKHGRELTR